MGKGQEAIGKRQEAAIDNWAWGISLWLAAYGLQLSSQATFPPSFSFGLKIAGFVYPLMYNMKISFLAVLVLIISCKKHTAEEKHHIPVATIIIHSPVAGAVYHLGDSVSVQALAVSSDNLHGYDVFITKANDTTTYFFQHIHEHNDSATIDVKWKAAIASPAELEAHVTVYLDHALNTEKKKVGFKVQ